MIIKSAQLKLVVIGSSDYTGNVEGEEREVTIFFTENGCFIDDGIESHLEFSELSSLIEREINFHNDQYRILFDIYEDVDDFYYEDFG